MVQNIAGEALRNFILKKKKKANAVVPKSGYVNTAMKYAPKSSKDVSLRKAKTLLRTLPSPKRKRKDKNKCYS